MFVLNQTKHNTNRDAKSGGFTLIETVIVIALTTMVTLAIFSAIYYFYRTNRRTLKQALAIQKTSNGIDRMVEDIREATPAENGSYPIKELGDYKIILYSNVDKDIRVEKVKFWIDGTVFKRAVTQPSNPPTVYKSSDTTTSIVSKHVRNKLVGKPVFTYFRPNGNKLVNLENVTQLSYIRFNFIVNMNPDRSPGITLRSSATLRNLVISDD